MANSVIPYQNPITVVNGAIRSITRTRGEGASNYLSSGLNANSNVVIAAYESADNPLGVVCSLGRAGTNVHAYLYKADGTPYTGEASITFYYIPIA